MGLSRRPISAQAFADSLTPAQAIALIQIADPLTDAERAEFAAMSDDDLLRELSPNQEPTNVRQF